MCCDLNKLSGSGATELIADIRIPSDSPWFKGHFPNNPVLPGIAQLEMVFNLIRQTLGHPIRLAAVNHVRFKQMILPADELRVVVSPKEAQHGRYTFRILKTDELVTSGVITIA